MQIERVETYPLLYRLPQAYGDANGYKKYRSSYLIRLITRSGIDGWGEVIDWLPTLDIGFRERIIPYLVGKHASDRLEIVKTISKWHQRSAAGVSMALTEIVAKRAGLSVCELWGGAMHQKVPLYASFQSYSEDADWMTRSISRVANQVASGFCKVKVKIGGRKIREDQKHIEYLMNSLSPDVRVALDANQSYDLSAMLEWKHFLSRYPNWMWIEEPMPMEKVQEYARLRQALSVPLAGGENLTRCQQFLPLYMQGAIDIAQPDSMHTEGIDEYRTHVALARQFGYRISPHAYDGSLSRLYALFAQACLPAWSKMAGEKLEPVELDVMDNPFTGLFELTYAKGEALLPQGPGIGLEPNWDVIRAFRWDGSMYV